MNMNLDANTMNKVIETTKNFSQVAANLTKPQKPQNPPQKPDQMNQPHTQTVEVKVGEQTPATKPTIIKEKSETHVHKVFPDSRELNERECAVRELELKNEHEYKMAELHFRMDLEAQARKERKEREERAEKDRERRRERDRKFTRNLCIGMGAVVVLAAGAAIYDSYTSSRSSGGRRLFVPAQEKVVPAEGKVE